MNICPLCAENKRIVRVKGPVDRLFLHCENCFLIFTDRGDHPSIEDERIRYLTHNNSIENQGYIDFLNRAIKPALEFIEPGMAGLDYGCGPGPVLSLLIEKSGMTCDNYDPIFFPDLNRGKQYDFIFATECAEHFFCPGKEFQKIIGLLKPGGILTLMTELWKTVEEFRNWWYPRDNTHVTFYHEETLKYISQRYDMSCLFMDGKSVCVFRNGS